MGGTSVAPADRESDRKLGARECALLNCTSRWGGRDLSVQDFTAGTAGRQPKMIQPVARPSTSDNLGLVGHPGIRFPLTGFPLYTRIPSGAEAGCDQVVHRPAGGISFAAALPGAMERACGNT